MKEVREPSTMIAEGRLLSAESSKYKGSEAGSGDMHPRNSKEATLPLRLKNISSYLSAQDGKPSKDSEQMRDMI